MKRLRHFVITTLDGKKIKEGKFKPFAICPYSFMKVRVLENKIRNGKRRFLK